MCGLQRTFKDIVPQWDGSQWAVAPLRVCILDLSPMIRDGSRLGCEVAMKASVDEY